MLGYCCVTIALLENFRLQFAKFFFSTAEKYHSKNENLIAYCAWVRNLCALLRNHHQSVPRTNFFIKLEDFSISVIGSTDCVEANKLCCYLQ